MKIVRLSFVLVGAAQVLTRGDGGMQITVAVYDDSSCRAPPHTMTITRRPGCTPQSDQSKPVCASSGMVNFVEDCVHYYAGSWDDYAVIYNAFGRGNVSFLIEEDFNTESVGWCGDNNAFTNATVYLLNENCHTNLGGTSTKFTIGHSLILTKYADPTCTAAVNVTEITQAMLSHRSCLDNRRRYYLGGPRPSLAAVAVFEDSSCSEKPVEIKFTRGFKCRASRDSAKTECKSDGVAYYSISSCFNDYFELASSVFGSNSPYIVVEEFSESYCSQAQSVTVYIADGACHSNTDDVTSFKATLAPQGSATITTYSDTYCNTVQEIIDVSRQILAVYMCVSGQGCESEDDQGCGRQFSVGGLGGPAALGRMTSYELYGSDDCSQPAQTVTITRELSCTPQLNHWQPVCEDSEAMYFVRDCIDYFPGGSDPYGVIYNAFGPNAPYLLVEEYDSDLGRCGDYSALINATAYLLDETCHTNLARTTSIKLTIDRSLILTKYDDPDCITAVHTTEVTQAMINHGTCVDNSSRYYLGGPRPSITAVAVFEDSNCLESPIMVKFTRGFLCEGPKTVCEPYGATHHSISSCSDDYFSLASTRFGDKAPYIVVEEFLESSCSKAAPSVIVYKADGGCHLNLDDATSFKAMLAQNGAATLVTYRDPNCSAIQEWFVMSEQISTPSVCISDQGCTADSDFGCGRRFTVGGFERPKTCKKIEFPDWLWNEEASG